MTRRALTLLLLLSACAPLAERDAGGLAKPVMEPEVTASEPAAEACVPGDDDGIGGTGCKVD